MDTPICTSAAINTALQQLGPLLNDYKGMLDKISTDILAVEKLISESGFAIEVWVPLQNNHNYHIGWSKSEDRWRIMFRSTNSNSPPRPLIETPTEIRLDCTASVAQLMNSITSKLQVAKR